MCFHKQEPNLYAVKDEVVLLTTIMETMRLHVKASACENETLYSAQVNTVIQKWLSLIWRTMIAQEALLSKARYSSYRRLDSPRDMNVQSTWELVQQSSLH